MTPTSRMFRESATKQPRILEWARMSQPNDQSKSILTTGQYCPHQMLIPQPRPAHPDSSDQISHKIKLVILELKLINHLCSSLSPLSRKAYMRFVHKSISSDLNSISHRIADEFQSVLRWIAGEDDPWLEIAATVNGKKQLRVTSPGVVYM